MIIFRHVYAMSALAAHSDGPDPFRLVRQSDTKANYIVLRLVIIIASTAFAVAVLIISESSIAHSLYGIFH